MSYSETISLKKEKIDKHVTLHVTQNKMSGRIFVEFYADKRKLVLQKSFQDTYSGHHEAEQFEKTITSLNDLKAYFGIKQEHSVE